MSPAPRCPALLRLPPAEDAAGLFSDRFLYRTFCSVTGHAPYLWNKRWVRCRPLNLEGNASSVGPTASPVRSCFGPTCL